MKIKEIIKERILVIDGAMGTMIQTYNLSEKDFRGVIFKNTKINQKGNYDILSITKPKLISDIHQQFLESGADIITTNTFMSNAVSMQRYGLENEIEKLNLQSAKIAKKIAKKFTDKNPNKARFVAGSVGPTHLSHSQIKHISTHSLHHAYSTQIKALIKGGVDIILIETIFDIQNARTAFEASNDVMKELGVNIPIMISASISDKTDALFGGETFDKFISSFDGLDIISIGLNCTFDIKHLQKLRNKTQHNISAYPNAGLPNKDMKYNESPKVMAKRFHPFIENNEVQIIGGCCGTTPEHIQHIANMVNFT